MKKDFPHSIEAAGERLSFEQASHMYENEDLLTLGARADEIRRRFHPDGVVTYVVDRNINYTNICTFRGASSAPFSDLRDDADGYVIARTSSPAKSRKPSPWAVPRSCSRAACTPISAIECYLDLLSHHQGTSSPCHIHGFSPSEIRALPAAGVRRAVWTSSSTDFIDAGLGSIPGGGGEILVDRVRQRVSPRKCMHRRWLEVMDAAHRLGLRTTATMMFGHSRPRRSASSTSIASATCRTRPAALPLLSPGPSSRSNTDMRRPAAAGAYEYLNTLAIARLFLDNVPNVQAPGSPRARRSARSALFFGANDMGSTMIEENVVAAAGVRFRLSEEELIRLIGDAGFQSAKRDTFYTVLKRNAA